MFVRFWNCDFKFVTVLELHQSMINDINKRVLNWRFTLVLIKINYGQIGDQTGLFYTTNPIFYTSGNRFVRRTGTFGNLIFSLVPSDNRNTRSTCPTSVFTGIGQTLMSRPGLQTFYCRLPATTSASVNFFENCWISYFTLHEHLESTQGFWLGPANFLFCFLCFVFYFVCHVPNVACAFGLSVLDCPFSFFF